MSLSDCPKCWDTPCSCGHEYKNWSVERKVKIISAIIGMKEKDVAKMITQYNSQLVFQEMILTSNGAGVS
jgi:hypothetical protein